MRALKGHGTGNDFIIVPTGPDFSPAEVALLCDRQLGIGADGLIRIVPTAEADDAFVRGQADDANWFMDYRNADGSVAEMCGNGVRVFVHALIREGLADVGSFTVATRGGVRQVTIDEVGGAVSVQMGVGEPLLPSSITIAEGATFPAAGMLFPNPHAVVFVDDLDDAGDLLDVPSWQPTERYPNGVNIEFVRMVGPRHIELRVHERGVGETMSCGTGICAAVAVARDAEQDFGANTWTVDVPGGRVTVHVDESGEATLRGPAVIVAELDIDEAWLRREA